MANLLTLSYLRRIIFKDNFIIDTLNQMFLDKNCGAKCLSNSESPNYLTFRLDLENNENIIKIFVRLPIDPLLDMSQMKALDNRAGISNIDNEETRIKLRILFANLECVKMVRFKRVDNREEYWFRYDNNGLLRLAKTGAKWKIKNGK